MCLRNQVFQSQTKAENQRKLEVVLRSLTDDQLTTHQRRLIAYAIGCRRQYRFQLCHRPDCLPCAADAGDDHTVIRQIFGTAEGGETKPAAVLVRRPVQGQETNTVYIYLPKEKEEQGDDARKKETGTQ